MQQLKDLLNSMTILKDMSIDTMPLLVICWVLAVTALAVIALAIYRSIHTKDLSRYIASLTLLCMALCPCIKGIVNCTEKPYDLRFVISAEYLITKDMHHYFEVPDLQAEDTIVITPRDEYYDDVFEWYKSHTTRCTDTKT